MSNPGPALQFQTAPVDTAPKRALSHPRQHLARSEVACHALPFRGLDDRRAFRAWCVAIAITVASSCSCMCVCLCPRVWLMRVVGWPLGWPSFGRSVGRSVSRVWARVPNPNRSSLFCLAHVVMFQAVKPLRHLCGKPDDTEAGQDRRVVKL